MAEVDINQIKSVIDPELVANQVAGQLGNEMGLSNMTFYDLIPPRLVSSMETLFFVLRILAIVFIIYLIIRIFKAFYDLGTGSRVRKTYNLIRQVNEKLDLMIEGIGKSDRALREHLEEINKSFKESIERPNVVKKKGGFKSFFTRSEVPEIKPYNKKDDSNDSGIGKIIQNKEKKSAKIDKKTDRSIKTKKEPKKITNKK